MFFAKPTINFQKRPVKPYFRVICQSIFALPVPPALSFVEVNLVEGSKHSADLPACRRGLAIGSANGGGVYLGVVPNEAA